MDSLIDCSLGYPFLTFEQKVFRLRYHATTLEAFGLFVEKHRRCLKDPCGRLY